MILNTWSRLLCFCHAVCYLFLHLPPWEVNWKLPNPFIIIPSFSECLYHFLGLFASCGHCSLGTQVQKTLVWNHISFDFTLDIYQCLVIPPQHTHTYMLHLSTTLLFWQAKSHLGKSILLWRMHRNVKIIFIFKYAVVEFINIISPPYLWMGNPPKERTNWTVPVYTWDLSTCEFSYPQGSWTQMPLDTERRLYLK